MMVEVATRPQPVIHVFVDALVNPIITVTNTQGMSAQTDSFVCCIKSFL